MATGICVPLHVAAISQRAVLVVAAADRGLPHPAQPVRLLTGSTSAPQTDINEKMRAILIDWLVEVHLKFKVRNAQSS
jgi:hypothetical protein